MQVILLESDKKLGGLGTITNVKAGYARNYLIPQAKARFATKENIALFEKEKDVLIAKANDLLEQAKQQAEKMTDLVCHISAHTSDEGKLFGSVGTTQISQSMAQTGYEVQKRNIHLPDGPIRHIGEYQINISLHAEVEVMINIEIIAQ